MDKVFSLGVWLIPIAAIVVWGVTEVVRTVLKYQERARMIDRGMDPDAPHRNPDAR